MEKHPPGHISNTGYDGSRWSNRPLAFVKGNLFDLVLLFLIGEGEISGFLGCARREQTAAHTQPIKNPLLNKVFPALTGQLPHQVTCDHVHQVLVLEDGPKILVWFEILKAVEEFLAGARGVIPHE